MKSKAMYSDLTMTSFRAPKALVFRAKARAAEARITFSDYVRQLISRDLTSAGEAHRDHGESGPEGA